MFTATEAQAISSKPMPEVQALLEQLEAKIREAASNRAWHFTISVKNCNATRTVIHEVCDVLKQRGFSAEIRFVNKEDHLWIGW